MINNFFKTPSIKSLAVMLGFFIFCLELASAQQGVPIEKRVSDKLILLKNYDSQQNLKGWVFSEKYDGMRAYWDGEKLSSRNGYQIIAPKWFTAGFPDFELDGELWLGRQKFAELMTIVKDSSPGSGWDKVSYQIFEVPNQPGDLYQRLAVLEKFLRQQPSSFIKIVKQEAAQSHSQVEKKLLEITAAGGEGLVLRDASKPYLSGRQNSIQKVKQKQDAECTVIGYTPGKGKYLGLVGALRCELVTTQLSRLFPKLSATRQQVIKIGSGLTDELRARPPEIGSVITFQYMGVTKNGFPRFPVYLRQKNNE